LPDAAPQFPPCRPDRDIAATFARCAGLSAFGRGAVARSGLYPRLHQRRPGLRSRQHRSEHRGHPEDGRGGGFAVDASDDPAVFSDTSLKQYAAIVFSNSNNEAFTSDVQREAFKHYIESGGGFVGIHSASGSERSWPYFWSVLGGKFVVHPKLQTFTVQVVDRSFPPTKNLPVQFEWTDECYFIAQLNPDIHPLLVTDRTRLSSLELMKIDVSSFPNPLPLAWYHEFDGGREFYIALGHNKEEYANPLLYGMIEGGILWAMKMRP
jgi:uncharacterized protein